MKTVWISGLALALVAVPALADNERGFYAGLGTGVVSGRDHTPYEDARMPVLELSGGYKYNGLLGIEVRAGVGIKEDGDSESYYFQDEMEDNNSLSEIEREVDRFSAVYYRPELINQSARLYGLIGYAEVDTTVTRWEGNSSTEQEESVSGGSYGLGAGWYVNERVNFNIEYRQLVNADDQRFEALTIQWDYRF